MLVDVIDGVDMFLGLFGFGVLMIEMVSCMVDRLIIFVLVNFIFEILFEDVCIVVLNVIIVIGCLDYLNQVNNVLCFFFIFWGVLDVGVMMINDEMQLVCIEGIVVLVCVIISVEVVMVYCGEKLIFGVEYLIFKFFDLWLIGVVFSVVVKVVMEIGVVIRLFEDINVYKCNLDGLVFCLVLIMCLVFEVVVIVCCRIVFVEGEDEWVLCVVNVMLEEMIDMLILIGCFEVIEMCVECVGLLICFGCDFEIVNLENDLCYCDYWGIYYELMVCCGVMFEVVCVIMCINIIVIGVVMVYCNEVDSLICGIFG